MVIRCEECFDGRRVALDDGRVETLTCHADLLLSGGQRVWLGLGRARSNQRAGY